MKAINVKRHTDNILFSLCVLFAAFTLYHMDTETIVINGAVVRWNDLAFMGWVMACFGWFQVVIDSNFRVIFPKERKDDE